MEIDSSKKNILGNIGEKLVEEFLANQGFIIKNKNYRKRFGEIDLIAENRDLLIFVEVKLRKNKYFPISEVINYKKQKKIIMTAKAYISEFNLSHKLCRFDVAIIEKNYDNNFNINYISNAFHEGNDN